MPLAYFFSCIFCQSLPNHFILQNKLSSFPLQIMLHKGTLLLQNFSQRKLTISVSKFVLTDWKAKFFILLLENASEHKLSIRVHKPPTLISEPNLLVGLFQTIQPHIVQRNEMFNLPIASCFQVTSHKKVKLVSKQIIFRAKLTLFLNICNNLFQ